MAVLMDEALVKEAREGDSVQGSMNDSTKKEACLKRLTARQRYSLSHYDYDIKHQIYA